MDEENQELANELVVYYRSVLVTHANNLESGVCAVCQVARCPDWLNAYDKLAASCQLMGEPSQWDSYPPRGKQ